MVAIGHLELHSKFLGSLGHRVKHCLKQVKEKRELLCSFMIENVGEACLMYHKEAGQHDLDLGVQTESTQCLCHRSFGSAEIDTYDPVNSAKTRAGLC